MADNSQLFFHNLRKFIRKNEAEKLREEKSNALRNNFVEH